MPPLNFLYMFTFAALHMNIQGKIWMRDIVEALDEVKCINFTYGYMSSST
jgi:hypothetical protein